MDGKSLTPQEVTLKQLQKLMPEVFSENKVDFEKLKATLGEDINFSNERYVLNWAGKSDAFRALQTPTTKTLVPAKDESVNFDRTENVFIEGENLEVLKVLQKSYFGKIKMIYIDPPYNTGNDSFIYPDKFSETKDEYQKRVGDKDEEGYMTKDGMFRKNSKENGQYHSNWLNMMYPRLFLAKNLLRQDGVIFISIDDNEVHNLRMMMNEIFGEENFIGSLSVENNPKGRKNSDFISVTNDFLLIYAKEISRTNFLENIPKDIKDLFFDEASGKYIHNSGKRVLVGESSNEMVSNFKSDKHYTVYYNKDKNDLKTIKEKFINNYDKGLIDKGYLRYISKKNDAFQECTYTAKKLLELFNDKALDFKNDKIFEKNFNTVIRIKSIIRNIEYTTVIDNKTEKYKIDVKTTSAGTCLKNIFKTEKPIFPMSKNVGLIKLLSTLFEEKNLIILDFFSGSGTTAHAVMDLNKEDGGKRKYICVQLPEQCDEESEAFKAGYTTIADIAKERIRRAGKKIAEEINTTNNEEKQIDLGFKVLKLSDSNFKQWQQIEGKDAKALAEQMNIFVDPVSENATIENMVYELLLKSGKGLNSTLESKSGYFCINTNEIILLLEHATQEIVNAVLQEKPQKVIALDRLFRGNDQLKTNTALQMKDANIEFKTI